MQHRVLNRRNGVPGLRLGAAVLVAAYVVATLTLVSGASARVSIPEISPSASVALSSKAVKRRAAARRRAALKRRAAQRARTRRSLSRSMRRNPRAVLTKSFLRKAQTVNFKLPMTVRLREGAAIEVTWLDLRRPLNGITYPAPPPQTLSLKGQFAMELEFGSNIGGFGSLPSRTGHNAFLSSDSPLRVANFGDCSAPPPDPEPAFLEKTPSTPLSLTSGGLSWSLLNPFTGAAEGDLYLKSSFRSRVRRTTSSCNDPYPGEFADFDLPPSPTGGEGWNQPIRVAWNGRFRIAPAITEDGALRLGKITATEPAQPQPVTSANIWACAPSAALTGPTVPTGNACTEIGLPLTPPMEAVGAAPFPAQLKFTSFNADVMIGSVPPLP